MRRTNKNLDKRVKELASKFSILNGWNVFAAPYEDDCNEVICSESEKSIHIKPWDHSFIKDEPADYVLHEIMHALLFVYEVSFIRSKDDDELEPIEERLVNDMCSVFKVRK